MECGCFESATVQRFFKRLTLLFTRFAMGRIMALLTERAEAPKALHPCGQNNDGAIMPLRVAARPMAHQLSCIAAIFSVTMRDVSGRSNGLRSVSARRTGMRALTTSGLSIKAATSSFNRFMVVLFLSKADIS
jgi:hypothetical protein